MIKEGYEYLYFQNGKPKKKYMFCLNEGAAEMRRLYGEPKIQCFGLRCPYYAIGCGRYELEKYEAIKEK